MIVSFLHSPRSTFLTPETALMARIDILSPSALALASFPHRMSGPLLFAGALGNSPSCGTAAERIINLPDAALTAFPFRLLICSSAAQWKVASAEIWS